MGCLKIPLFASSTFLQKPPKAFSSCVSLSVTSNSTLCIYDAISFARSLISLGKKSLLLLFCS